MRRVVARVCLMLGLCIMGGLQVPAAWGQSAPYVWFEDSFCSGSLSGWTISPLGLQENWSAASGRAAYTGGGHTQLYTGAAVWTDYSVEARFRLRQSANYPGGLRGRVNTTTGESYAAWIYPAEGVIRLYRTTAWHIDTPGLTELAAATVGPFELHVFHTLRLSFSGSQIVVTLNNAPVIAATDATYAAGAIALDVSTQPIEFDDVLVTSAAPPPDTQAPSVSMVAPAAGAVVAGSVDVSASASDNVGVAGVQFQIDGQPLGAEDTAAPYTISWNTTTVGDGDHVLRAVARDAAGLVTMSAPVTVTVRNTPPTVLFSDDFASGTLSNWTPSPLGLFANWTAAANAASYNGGGHTQIHAGSDAWTNYTVEARIRLANGSNFPGGVRGRVSTTTGAGYAAWLYPASGLIKLFRTAAWHIDTPGVALLGEAPVTIPAGAFHTLALSFDGSSIQVRFNGATVLSVDDAALAAGAIALDVSNQPIEYDDIVVTRIAPGEPPPTQGPGGPILVLSTASDPFSRYYGEILLAEGLNQYHIRDITTIDAPTLAAYDVVVLASMPVTTAHIALLTAWVDAGGNLIAMRPAAPLSGLLGLTAQGGTLGDAYLAVNTATPAGAGITAETLQFHGLADVYTLSGASAVATLFSNAATATPHPAVTLREVGASGGQAAAFTYDLAQSIVWTRQGNPAWSGQERDNNSLIRSDDLFFGAAPSDPQPDWINLDKVAIPQADEQQRLLANLIQTMNRDRKPLPRFWYLPRGERAAIVMTGDDHANNGTAGRFQGYEALSPAGCSVDLWECVRGTSYIYPNTPLPPAQAAAFDAAGFEIGVHVNTGCANWTPGSLQTFYTNDLASFAAAFPALPAATTTRTHCIAWSDYVTQAKVERSFGIRFDTNYYYWPGTWVLDRPGFFTGSGLPMRFADVNGASIDVYQAVTQMTDESSQSFPFTIDTLLDRALGPEGYYAVLTANMHTDSPDSAGSDAIVHAALARGVPIVTARQMLRWLDGRNGSSFANVAKTGAVLTFAVNAASGSDGLQGLLPAASAAGTLATLTRNGAGVAFEIQVIKGISYAVFPALAGSYQATYSAP